MQQKIFTATQARQKFFDLLRLAEEGVEPVIVKKDRGTEFKLSVVKRRKKKDKLKILEEMGKIGLKSGTPEEIKAILVSKSDIHIVE